LFRSIAKTCFTRLNCSGNVETRSGRW